MARYIQPPYPEYLSYYISMLPETGTPYELLTGQLQKELPYLEHLPEGVRLHQYAPEKWTVAQVVGHVADTERIFGYRALCIARNDQQSLPGFDENAYVRNARFNDQPLAEIFEELLRARQANLALVRHLADADMDKVGNANGNAVSLHAVLLAIAGHLTHHVSILQERYGV